MRNMLLFGAIFLVFALMVSSTSTAAQGEPIKDIDISLEQIPDGRVTAAEPGSGESIKENLDASVTAAEPGIGEPVKDIDMMLEKIPSSVTAAEPGIGEPVKDIDMMLEKIPSSVTAAVPGSGQPVKERYISLEDTSTDVAFDWDKFFAELEALFGDPIVFVDVSDGDGMSPKSLKALPAEKRSKDRKDKIATTEDLDKFFAELEAFYEKKSSAPIGIDEVGIHTRKPEPAGDVPVDFIGAAFGDPVVLKEASGGDGMSQKSLTERFEWWAGFFLYRRIYAKVFIKTHSYFYY